MRVGLAALVFAAALLVALQAQAFSAQAPMQSTSYPFSNPGCYSTSSSTVEITCNEILTGTLVAQNIQVDSGSYLDTNGFEIDALGTFTVKSGGYVVNFTSGGGLNGQGGYNSGGAPGCCATGLSPLPAPKGTSSKLSFSPAGKAVQALSFQGSGCYILGSNGVPSNDGNAPQDGQGCDGQIDGSFDSYVSGGIGGTGSSGGQCTASTSGTGGDGPYQTGVINFGGAGGNAGGGSAGVANPGEPLAFMIP